MKRILKTLALALSCIAFYNADAQDIIMGQQELVNDIGETVRYFYDEGGQYGDFDTNLVQTTTLKHNMAGDAFVLYMLFDEFVMGAGDTLWIYDGDNTSADLIGFFSLVNTPGELYSTGSTLTFVFKSDNINDPGLSSGWAARVYAFKKDITDYKFITNTEEIFSCNAKFYDSGGPTGKIANNNENTNLISYTTFHSPAETHIKCEFDTFSCNGILMIYDGPYVPGFPQYNGRLIGQFCTSTLPANGKPPVLFSSTHQLTFVYKGAANDKNKIGREATISCVPELYQPSDGSPCPSVTNVPGGAYSEYAESSATMHVIEFDCSKPVVMLEAQIEASGRYSNDYTITPISEKLIEDGGARMFEYNDGSSITGICDSEDDKWLNPQNLPFDFSFFGKTYNKVYPGTNGMIAFDPKTSCSSPGFQYPVPPAGPPYNNVPYKFDNCIYGVWEDIDCNYFIDKNDGLGMGDVRLDVMGSTPCRAFVFNYLNVGLYGNHSSNDKFNTYQMVFYEGTNVIDVFIKHRNFPATTNDPNNQGWDGHNEGVIGIQNAKSSQIQIAPGRGMTGWKVLENQNQSEGWRFTPITPLDEYGELTWYENVVDEDHIISHDPTAKNRRITVSPTDTMMVISEYKFTNAAGDNIQVRDTTVINVNIPKIELSRASGGNQSQYVCPGDTVMLQVVTDTLTYPNILVQNFKWSSGGTTQIDTVNPTKTTLYAVTVTYNNGCTRSDTIRVNVTDLALPTITVLEDRDTICYGESTTLVAAHPTSNDFKWSNGATNPMITVSPQETTEYAVTVTMTGDCEVFAKDTIVVNPLPVPQFNASPTEIFVENGIGTVSCTDMSQEDYHLLWNFGDYVSNTNIVQDVSDPTHDYTRAGFYTITLTATTDNGCVDSVKSRVTVTVPYFFYIPNAFTPANKDGLNDRFAPQGAGVDPNNYSMQIYDRNGNIIFNTNNPFDYWDGKNKNGTLCPEGVYVYIIRLKNLNDEIKEYTGSVTLLK